jgi:hypothetical protein
VHLHVVVGAGQGVGWFREHDGYCCWFHLVTERQARQQKLYAQAVALEKRGSCILTFASMACEW